MHSTCELHTHANGHTHLKHTYYRQTDIGEKDLEICDLNTKQIIRYTIVGLRAQSSSSFFSDFSFLNSFVHSLFAKQEHGPL